MKNAWKETAIVAATIAVGVFIGVVMALMFARVVFG